MAAFFTYECFLRTLLGLFAQPIMHDLSLNHVQFAALGAAFFLGYGLFQLPLGHLLDRVLRLERALAAMLVVCCLSVLALSWANSFMLALGARFLMGLSVSAAFVMVLLTTRRCFAPSRFPTITGFVQALGGLGAMSTLAPLAYVMDHVSSLDAWRSALCAASYPAMLLLLLSLVLWHSNRSRTLASPQPEPSPAQPNNLCTDLLQLARRPALLRLSATGAFLYFPLPFWGLLWGHTYVQSLGYSHHTAAWCMTLLWLGFIVGCPALGLLDRYPLRRNKVVAYAAGLALSASWLLTRHELMSKHVALLVGTCCVLGVTAAAHNLCFASISQRTAPQHQGLALSLANLSITLLVSFASPLISHTIAAGTPYPFSWTTYLLCLAPCVALSCLVFTPYDHASTKHSSGLDVAAHPC